MQSLWYVPALLPAEATPHHTCLPPMNAYQATFIVIPARTTKLLCHAGVMKQDTIACPSVHSAYSIYRVRGSAMSPHIPTLTVGMSSYGGRERVSSFTATLKAEELHTGLWPQTPSWRNRER